MVKLSLATLVLAIATGALAIPSSLFERDDTTCRDDLPENTLANVCIESSPNML